MVLFLYGRGMTIFCGILTPVFLNSVSYLSVSKGAINLALKGNEN
jgi:hypothetical protein